MPHQLVCSTAPVGTSINRPRSIRISSRVSNQEAFLATEQQIRDYAHMLWEQAGKPEGRDIEFCHAAEVELNAESESPDAATIGQTVPIV